MVSRISKNTWIGISIFSLILVLNLTLTTLPLLNILSYESSVVNAVILSFLSGLFWLYYFYRKAINFLKINLLLFTSTPLIILAVSTIMCQQCPLDNGIYFYFLFVLPAIAVSIAIASISQTLSNKWKYLIYILGWLFVLVSFLPELYFNPQIYFYNPIFGYYPGVIYDQNIEISLKLISFQLINLSISLVVIYLLNFIKNFKKSSKDIVMYGVMLSFILTYFIKPTFGLSTNLNRIKTELKEEMETQHFRIIIPDTLSSKQKKVLEYDHEYYYQSILNLLQTDNNDKITSIIFDPGAQKKRLFGSENADVAKPWLNQIYISLGNYENSLKHEISHIFSAQYSSGLFKVPLDFNPGMIEGFAMAVENDYDNLDIDYMAALAYKYDYDVSISDLFSNYSFFANASSLSYIYAGSFFKYLANKYGWQKCAVFYSGNKFEDIFGKNIMEVENDYKNYLSTIVIEDNKHNANYYFSRKPLVKLFCARATAKELKYAKGLFDSKKYEDASEKYLEIYEYSNTYAALVGYIQSKIFLEDKNDAISKLSDEIVSFEGTGSYYYLEFLLADLHSLKGDSNSALRLYESIIEQNPHPIYLRSATVKKQLLLLGDSVLIEYMINRKDKINVITNLVSQNPSDYLLQTLCIMIENGDQEYGEMINLLTNSIKLNEFNSETYFELSKLAYKNLDFENSIKFANLALKNAKFKNKSIILDHLSKLEWILNFDL